MPTAPVSATLFAYKVGFGDCFLLRFSYPGNLNKHLLIDFGTTGLPPGEASTQLLKIAQSIREECGGKLDAVVASHRHADHISGFATSADGKGSGDIIRSLKPDVVVQPWTEDLKLAVDAQGPAGAATALARSGVRTLAQMQRAAGNVVHALDVHEARFPKAIADQLRFIGEDNLSNVSAVNNLATMGRKQVYTYHEGPSGLETVLLGVKTHVLGPPTLKQSKAIAQQRSRDEKEYWHLQASRLADLGAHVGEASPVFPDAIAAKGSKLPAWARWLADRMQQAQHDQTLQIVRSLDKQMNNTSLILLFETANKKLLFPGDAQIENWSLALGKPKYLELLADVDLYKVGHHGSLNATPRTMWGGFMKKGATNKSGRLKSVLSTMPGKHGEEAAHTEVPRASLLKELTQHTELHSTHTLATGALFERVQLAL